ncbi:MAG: hypothetical protein Q8M92_01210 [Candidatus Subteraquimicrobiales bacterium]|nr:hypothetical protein [Candidatus Subteraquimicrobiales bacterium]
MQIKESLSVEDIVYEKTEINATGMDILLEYLKIYQGFIPSTILLVNEEEDLPIKYQKIEVSSSHPGERIYKFNPIEKVLLQGAKE